MDKIMSVIGDESDLICIECKQEKKTRLSAYCLKCKIKLDPYFLKKFKHFRHSKNLEAFNCFECNNFLMEKRGYVTYNLQYLCEECYRKVKNVI